MNLYRSAIPGSRPGICRLVLFRLLLGDLRLEFLHHIGVAERGDVAQGATLGDVAAEAAHDLAGAGLRQVVGPDDPLRAGEFADVLGDGFADALDQLVAFGDLATQGDEGADRLAGSLARLADTR